MAARTLIIVDDSGFEVWQHRGRNIRLQFQVAGHTEPARQELRHWIERHAADDPCAILVVNADERLAVDHLPRCSRRDRQALLARRLAQQFPANPFTAHLPLPSLPDATNRETVLLAGLGSTDALSDLITVLERCALPITHVVTPALLLQRLPLRTPRPDRNELLLCFDGPTMQIVLISDGALRFTRQSRGRTTLLSGCIADHLQTLTQTCAYLVGQRLLDARPTHRATVIAATDDHETLSALADAGFEITLIAPQSLMLPHPRPVPAPDTAQGSSRALMVQLLAKPPKSSYLPRPLRHRYPLWRTARLATSASAIGLIAALSISAIRLVDASQGVTQAAQLEAQAVDTRRQTSALTEADQHSAVPAHATLALAHALHEHQQLEISPGQVMRHLSTLLADAPSLRLQHLAWSTAAAAAATVTASPQDAETASMPASTRTQTDITVHARIRANNAGEAAATALEVAMTQWRARPGHQLDWQWLPTDTRAPAEPTDAPALEVRLTIARDILTQPTDGGQP